MTTLLCRLGWHAWGHWQTARQYETRAWPSELDRENHVPEAWFRTGVAAQQERTCARCGRLSLRLVTARLE